MTWLPASGSPKQISGWVFAAGAADRTEDANSEKDQSADTYVHMRYASFNGPPDQATQKNRETEHIKRKRHFFLQKLMWQVWPEAGGVPIGPAPFALSEHAYREGVGGFVLKSSKTGVRLWSKSLLLLRRPGIDMNLSHARRLISRVSEGDIL
jgi:hypothetical protein